MMERTVTLRFSPKEGEVEAVGMDISALAIIGRTLFCASDETAAIERLVFDAAHGTFRDHRSIPLEKIFPLPAGDEEIDIEGLAVHDGKLWITGSHSLKRTKPDDERDPLADLGRLKWDANRSFIGYLPLKDAGNGVFEPDLGGKPKAGGPRPRMMKIGSKGKKGLRWLLRDCALLEPFMNVPAKENGFDVEGLAVVGDRVVVGLRGPVLGRYAFLVSMAFKEAGKGFLKPRRIDGSRYRLHTLDMGGFGIRDLLMVGDELLILAGPTQSIEGIARVYAVPAFSADEEVLTEERLKTVVTLPMREECDHAEGIAHFVLDGEELLLVAHDNPAPERHDERTHELLLDAVRLTGREQ